MELIVFLLAIGLIYYTADARKRIEELTRRLGEVEREVFGRFGLKKGALPTPAAEPQIAPPVEPHVEPHVEPGAPIPLQVTASTQVIPPPVRPIPDTAWPSEPTVTSPRARPRSPPRSIAPEVNWEQFMGVKGFAWLGGFALFLGVAFFIKYSFDNNLISPQLRAAIGFLTGLSLLVGRRCHVGEKIPDPLANA